MALERVNDPRNSAIAVTFHPAPAVAALHHAAVGIQRPAIGVFDAERVVPGTPGGGVELEDPVVGNVAPAHGPRRRHPQRALRPQGAREEALQPASGQILAHRRSFAVPLPAAPLPPPLARRSAAARTGTTIARAPVTTAEPHRAEESQDRWGWRWASGTVRLPYLSIRCQRRWTPVTAVTTAWITTRYMSCR